MRFLFLESSSGRFALKALVVLVDRIDGSGDKDNLRLLILIKLNALRDQGREHLGRLRDCPSSFRLGLVLHCEME